MKYFLIFEPDVLEFGADIVRAIHAKDSDATFCGIHTWSNEIVEQVRSFLPEDIVLDPVVNLDDFEREWLEVDDSAALEKYEEMLGPWALNQIIIADRHMGAGYVSCGLLPRTRVRSHCESELGLRSYLLGMLEFFHDFLVREKPDVIVGHAIAGGPALALYHLAGHLGIPYRRIADTRVEDRFTISDSPDGSLRFVVEDYAAAREDSALLAPWREKAGAFVDAFVNKPAPPKYVEVAQSMMQQGISLHYYLSLLRHVLQPDVRPKAVRAPIPWHRLYLELRRDILSRIPYRFVFDRPGGFSVILQVRILSPTVRPGVLDHCFFAHGH